MIKTLLEYLPVYGEIDITARRLKHGLLITISNINDTVYESFTTHDSNEYIRLTLFEMLDRLGYTPREIKAVDDFI